MSASTRTIWRVIFSVIMALGLYAAFVRIGRGLGGVTNLTDDFPWGLWVGFDILVGVGLAAGGFVIAATVHIFNIKRYRPIARPAILTAFLGYLLVIFALMFDLGRPDRIWHPLVMGNPHSVMFEVAMCVMLYTMVLALEFSPLVFKRIGWQWPVRVIHSVYIPIVILGVLLSTLHQSSLGTLYVIVPTKLHPLWYTPLLPVFFFISAIAAGLAMTIFESYLSYRAFGRRLEPHLLRGLARVIVVLLAVLLVWKVQNLAERGSLHYVFEPGTESVMFWGEMLLGIALPMVLLMFARVRESNDGIFFAAMLTIMGFILGRLNVAITGIMGASGTVYVPSWMEFSLTIAIVALCGTSKCFPAPSCGRRPGPSALRVRSSPAGFCSGCGAFSSSGSCWCRSWTPATGRMRLPRMRERSCRSPLSDTRISTLPRKR
jgi:Ni/Fe-hydrogenase subunit HybB-like protein